MVPDYPVSLTLEGEPVLVVGGGRVAARKVEGLVACGAAVRVVAPAIDAAIRGQPGVTCEERPYQEGDVAGQRLVFTATDDPAVNRAVRADADRHGIWVNSADDPANCTFTLPSVARRGPITVAVSTGGRSPGLAAWLRRRYAAELGPEYETLLELLVEARDAVRSTGRATEHIDWQSALDSEILDLIRAGQVTKARERLHSWL